MGNPELPDKTNGCAYFERLFSPYLHRRLDRDQSAELADHLHSCERCSEQFGLAWRVATVSTIERPDSISRWRFSHSLSSLIVWAVLGFACLGLVIFSWSNLDPGRSVRRAGSTRIDDNRLTRLISVQTELLASMVDPLRGVHKQVSAELRSETVGFFQSLRAAEQVSDASGRGFADHLHELFRICDPVIGTWDRKEYMLRLAEQPLPRVVLVCVMNASPQFVLCRVSWGERPAFAFLTRGRKPIPEIFEQDAPLRLTYLLMSRP